MSNRLPSRGHSSTSDSSEHHHEVELIDNTISTQISPLESTRSNEQDTTSSNQKGKESGSGLHQQSHFRQGKELDREKRARYHDHAKIGKRSNLINGFIHKRSFDHVKGKENKNRSRSKGKRILELQEVSEEPDSAVDILYENQRGGVFFGKCLFSARALGNLDPAPWTNVAQKPSATDIKNSQPPDPSWKWVGKQWSIYPTEDSSDGWEYSFAFHGNFSWHKCKWWNSFVRRRAWVRKRVRKKNEDDDNNHYGNYFSVIPVKSIQRNLIPSHTGINCDESCMLLGKHKSGDETKNDIPDFNTLKRIMKGARIDREIVEAIENFVQNGKEGFLHLKDQMQEIMHLFIFQASRRFLYIVILKQLNLALNNMQKFSENEDADIRNHLEFLDGALKAAEEQGKHHEFWSEMKKWDKKQKYKSVT